eukprot:451537_1
MFKVTKRSRREHGDSKTKDCVVTHQSIFFNDLYNRNCIYGNCLGNYGAISMGNNTLTLSAKYEVRHYVEPIHDETNNWPWTLFNKWSVHSNSDHPLNVNNETLKYIKGGRLLHSGLATVTSSPDIDDMIKVVPELRNVVQ